MNETRLYHVYHRSPLWIPRPDVPEKPIPASELGWPQRYQLVARVEAGSPEDAYRLTQHLDRAWWENSEVILVCCSRSTSVGDVIFDLQGAAALVALIGFESLTIEEEHPNAESSRTNSPSEEDPAASGSASDGAVSQGVWPTATRP